MLWIPFFFAFGLLVGSFLNVCIYRIPNGQSIAWPASHCQSCHSTLQARDLIPVFSWLFTKGTCRYCHAPVSKQYPFIELTTGVLTVLVAFLINDYAQLAIALILLYNGIVISAIDYKYHIIPNKNNLLFLILGVCMSIFYLYTGNYPLLGNSLLGALAAIGIMTLFVLFGAWGTGDLKMMTALGLVLGLKLVLLSLFIGIILGGIAGLYLIVIKKQSSKSKMAFGPYLVIGALMSYTAGNQLLIWYFQKVLF